jgi:hypothetical protein
MKQLPYDGQSKNNVKPRKDEDNDEENGVFVSALKGYGLGFKPKV